MVKRYYFPLEVNSPRIFLFVFEASSPYYKFGRFPLVPESEVLLVGGMMINRLFLPSSWPTKHFSVYKHWKLLLCIKNQPSSFRFTLKVFGEDDRSWKFSKKYSHALVLGWLNWMAKCDLFEHAFFCCSKTWWS